MSAILHVVPGLKTVGNGMAVAARLLAQEHADEIVDADDFLSENRPVSGYDEVWVHSTWTPTVWRACWRILRAQVPLVRMPHGNLDPVRCRYHRLRKLAVTPIERWVFARTSRVVVTCAAERDWCAKWGVRGPFETVDLAHFFPLAPVREIPAEASCVRILYLGRRHPLKGVAYLERAVAEANRAGTGHRLELRLVGGASGAELASAWDWCDVLCLPTVSENFGLVVGEALARGRRVIVTDGAPAWENLHPGDGRLVYVKGYRDGTPEIRVRLLANALKAL